MKAKHSPSFPLSARAVFRASAPALQQIPRNFKQPTPAWQGSSSVERFKALAADPQAQEIAETFKGGNPGKKLLASTSGTITALKSIRETAASWYVVYYGEGDKEVRISKNDLRRRVFGTLEAAEAWAAGDSE